MRNCANEKILINFQKNSIKTFRIENEPLTLENASYWVIIRVENRKKPFSFHIRNNSLNLPPLWLVTRKIYKYYKLSTTTMGSSPDFNSILTYTEIIGYIDRYARSRKFSLKKLRPFQLEGFRIVRTGESLLLVQDTGSGKTLVALVGIGEALRHGKVAVYLVPHNQLLRQKANEIYDFFGGTVHVVTISGENRPMKREIQQYRKRLVIVGTFEAFRAFLFQMQAYKYFAEREPLGVVCVDEVHYINDLQRGSKLETMLYKIRDTYPGCQLCLLSATFEEASAELWAKDLGCQLLYDHPERKFIYVEKHRHNELDPDDLRDSLWKITFEKMVMAREFVEEFVETRQNDDGTVEPARVLIFCFSRRLAERIVNDALRKRWPKKHPHVWCDYIHAGLARNGGRKAKKMRRKTQAEVFDEFNKPGKIRILVSSPLLETGVDIEEIHAIAVTDPENYPPSKLAQMCGRSREDYPKVSFFLPKKNRKHFYSTIVEAVDEAGDEIIDLLSSPIRGEIHGFRLEPIQSQLSTPLTEIQLWEPEEIKQKRNYEKLERERELFKSQLVLETLYHRFATPTELEERLNQYNVEFDLNGILKRLKQRALIRKEKGFIYLTYIGEAMVESSLDINVITKGLRFHLRYIMNSLKLPRTPDVRRSIPKMMEVIREHWGVDPIPIKRNQRGHPTHFTNYMDLLTEVIAEKAQPELDQTVDPEFVEKRRVSIKSFMTQVNLQKDEDHVFALQYGHQISDGDFSDWVRLGSWVSIGMYLLYRGVQSHLTVGETYYEMPTDIFTLDGPTYRRMGRIIKRYQPMDVNWSRRPEPRARIIKHRQSPYPPMILAVLEYIASKGVTIKELQHLLRQQFRIFMGQPRRSDPIHAIQVVFEDLFPDHQIPKRLSFSRQVLHFNLNGILREKLVKRPDYSAYHAHRPPDRYWLDGVPQSCQTCTHFMNYNKPNQKTCICRLLENQGVDEIMVTGNRPACAGFQDRREEMNHCKTCMYFTAHPKNRPPGEKRGKCQLEAAWVWHRQPACPSYEKKQKTTWMLNDLDRIDKKRAHCPHCEDGIILIPTFRRATVCSNKECHAIIKRVRLTTGFSYVSRTNVQIPKHRLMYDEGLAGFRKHEYTRLIYLRSGETLTYHAQKGSDIPYFAIPERGGVRFWVDQARKVVIAGGSFAFDINILHEAQIPIKILTKAEVDRSEQRREIEEDLRNRLLTFQERDVPLDHPLLIVARDMVVAKILSNVHYSTLLSTGSREQCLAQLDYLAEAYLILERRKAKKEQLVRRLRRKHAELIGSRKRKDREKYYKYLNREISADPDLNPVRIISHLRSLEGNAERIAWDVIKESLPQNLWFSGRQIQRFARTDFYYGSKAYDPFNAALNQLYRLLEMKIGDSLAKAGFSRYYPGPGIVHQRKRSTTYRTAEHHRNRELIYDIMDAYRPPFRYYLLHAFAGTIPPDATPALQAWYAENALDQEAFFSGKTGWERVFYVQSARESQLEELFDLICQQPIPHGTDTSKPLFEIMVTEAKLFANLLYDEKEFHDAMKALKSLLPWFYYLAIPSQQAEPTPIERSAPFSAMGSIWLKYLNDKVLLARITMDYNLLIIPEQGISEDSLYKLGKAPDPNHPASIHYLLNLLDDIDPALEDILINAKLRNVLQLALKKPYELVELGISLEDAHRIHNGSMDYINKSQYWMDFSLRD